MRVGSTGALKPFAKAVVPLKEASDAYTENLKRKSGYEKVVMCAPTTLIRQLPERILTGLAGSVTNPTDGASKLVARICPTTLPYELDTAFGLITRASMGRE